jgi:hypothetical protein
METLDELLTRLSLTKYVGTFATSALKIEDLLALSVSELNELLSSIGVLKVHAIKVVMAILKLKTTFKTPAKTTAHTVALDQTRVVTASSDSDVSWEELCETDGVKGNSGRDVSSEVQQDLGQTTQEEVTEDRAALKGLPKEEFEGLMRLADRLVTVDLTTYRQVLREISALQKALQIR